MDAWRAAAEGVRARVAQEAAAAPDSAALAELSRWVSAQLAAAVAAEGAEAAASVPAAVASTALPASSPSDPHPAEPDAAAAATATDDADADGDEADRGAQAASALPVLAARRAEIGRLRRLLAESVASATTLTQALASANAELAQARAGASGGGSDGAPVMPLPADAPDASVVAALGLHTELAGRLDSVAADVEARVRGRVVARCVHCSICHLISRTRLCSSLLAGIRASCRPG